jgi:hypothetical protein
MAKHQCDGCGMPKVSALEVFRPDGMGDVFSLCSLCIRAVSARAVAAERERAAIVALLKAVVLGVPNDAGKAIADAIRVAP